MLQQPRSRSHPMKPSARTAHTVTQTRTDLSASRTLTDVIPQEVTFTNSGLALKWRVTILCSVAIALLGGIGTLTTYWVTRESIYNALRSTLNESADELITSYSSDSPTAIGDTQSITTGTVVVQIYTQNGLLLDSSDDLITTLDPELVINVHDQQERLVWTGSQQSEETGEQTDLMAVLTPASFVGVPGVFAIMSKTTHVNAGLNQVARALGLVAILLTIMGSVIAYFVANAALKPITNLAHAAARLDPNNLTPIYYQGPNDEIGQLHTVLDALIERLKAAMDAQRVFLAETSHELRTPLTSLKGFLERAQRRAPPEIRSDLDDAVRISQTMTRLVSDILQLSRGELLREYEPYLLDIFEDILKPVADEFPGVQLEGHEDNKEGFLLGDPDRLRQVVRNLVNNAVRACSDDATKVALHFGEEGEYVVLHIQDVGPGIPPESLQHIFKKFYRGKQGGSGLGLAIVKQIVETHEGHIEVESVLGQGTTFSVYLPALEGESDE